MTNYHIARLRPVSKPDAERPRAKRHSKRAIATEDGSDKLSGSDIGTKDQKNSARTESALERKEKTDVETIENKGRKKAEERKGKGEGRGAKKKGLEDDGEELTLGTEVRSGKKGKRTRAPSQAEAVNEKEDPNERQSVKQKKRKINPFPASHPPSIEWDQLALVFSCSFEF